ncbi:hypothetical protein DIPPA_33188 [Diplonema papillatum]|nr:hypothetical protein DIPPA_33188 [Diplonema papillatum]
MCSLQSPVQNMDDDSINSDGALSDAPAGAKFSICIQTLSMGLRSLAIPVTLSTTVGEIKAVIQTRDPAAPPPDRQRLTYNCKELHDDNTSLISLNPPPKDGSKFSMAFELKIDQEEVWEVSCMHFHGYCETLWALPSWTVGEVIGALRGRDGGELKWTGGRFSLAQKDLLEADVLAEVEGMESGKTLHFFPTGKYVNNNASPQLECGGDMSLLEMSDQNNTVYTYPDVNYSSMDRAQAATPSPLTSPSSRLYFDLRFFEGGAQLNLKLCCGNSKTVLELKTKAAAALERDHGRCVRTSLMKLVLNAQVLPDAEILKNIPVGDRGSLSAPAVVQAYVVQTSDPGAVSQYCTMEESDVEDEPEDATQWFGRGSGLKACQPHADVVLLVVGIIAIIVGTVMLDTTYTIGVCSSDTSAYRSVTCAPSKSYPQTYTPTIASVPYLEEPSEYRRPCPTCAFIASPNNLTSPFLAQRYCTQSDSATDASLASVTLFISPDLCDAIWSSSAVPQFFIDATFDGRAWRDADGKLLTIPAFMWEPGHPAAGMSQVVVNRNSCRLATVGPEAVGGAACEFKATRRDWEEGKCLGSVVAETAVSETLCAMSCSDWCYASVLKAREDQCTTGATEPSFCCVEKAEPAPGPQAKGGAWLSNRKVCGCALHRGTVDKNMTSAPSSDARAKYFSPQARVLHRSAATGKQATYVEQPGVDLRWPPGTVNKLVPDCTSACSCARFCKEQPMCSAFVYDSKQFLCALWGASWQTEPGAESPPAEKSLFVESMVSSHLCSVSFGTSYGAEAACLQRAWDFLAADSACTASASSCSADPTEASFGALPVVLIVVGSLLILFFCICVVSAVASYLSETTRRPSPPSITSHEDSP